jgi:hypothetical protein
MWVTVPSQRPATKTVLSLKVEIDPKGSKAIRQWFGERAMDSLLRA